MSNYDVDSTIHIVVPASGVTDDVRDRLIAIQASPSQDFITWTIDVNADSGSFEIEETLKRCLDLISSLKTNPWWSPDWAVTTWITLAASGEFVGIGVPHHISKYAGELDVDLVFSVYCQQKDCESGPLRGHG
jgi:hypothetical protein